MKPAETKRALEILDDAHGLSDDALESYLDSVCGEDSALRREVLGYLDCDVSEQIPGADLVMIWCSSPRCSRSSITSLSFNPRLMM